MEDLSLNQAHALLTGEACFQQALEDTGLSLRNDQVTWHDLTLVSSYAQAIQRRLAGYEDEHPAPISLLPAIRNIVQPALPGFEEFKDVEGFSFHRSFAPDLHLMVRYHKIHGAGASRMFELEIGVSVGKPDSHMFSPRKFVVSIFRLFGDEFSRPAWNYDTPGEMEICARESVELLRRILPRFEARLEKYFSLWPDDMPAAIERGRALSARESLQAALALAGGSENDIEIRFVNSVPRLANITSGVQKQIPILTEGRLGRLGSWRITGFLRGDYTREMIADVPCEGPIRLGWHKARSGFAGIREWIDSTEAAKKMRAFVGDDFDPATLTLQGNSPAHWLAHLEKRFCRIDARSGELIQ